MAALEAAHLVKALMVKRFSSTCDDPARAAAWYERNMDIWDPAKIRTHAPEGDSTRQSRDCDREGSPDDEYGPD